MSLTACIRVAIALCCAVAAGCASRNQPAPSSAPAVVAPGATLEHRQLQTGTAYRHLQQVRYELRLAEQDALNAEAAYEQAQKTADARKRDVELARKAHAAAQAREKDAALAYERGIQSVDEFYRTGGKPEPQPKP